MTRKTRVKKVIFVLTLTLLALFTFQVQKEPSLPATASDQNTQPQTIEWIDLLPKDAVKLIQATPVVDHNSLNKFELEKDKNAKRIQSGSIGKNFGVIMQSKPNNLDSQEKMSLKDVLISTGVRREFVNKKIKIAGYVVPLEYNDKHELTAFFFAPYFGACTHVPPPSPNQLIYVRSPQGIKIKDIFNPFWLTGILHIETTETEETVLGISSYSLNALNISEYKND